jgi:hypothetical protein
MVVTVLVVVVGGLYVVGRLNPAPTPPVTTDVLGPDNGEEVSQYIARAAESLGGPAGPDSVRWALISMAAPVDVAAGWQLTGSKPAIMVSQSIFSVPMERVQTPTARVPTGNTEQSFTSSTQVAAQMLMGRELATSRAQQVNDVAARRLRSGCSCLVGIVVRAELGQLRSIAVQPGVRAVQALPADARGGLFTVVPLLPTATTVVGPGPDDGPVPAQ